MIKVGNKTVSGVRIAGVDNISGISIFGKGCNDFDASNFTIAGQDYFQAAPSDLNYNYKLVTHYPKYKYKEIKNKKVILSCDYYISGLVENGRVIFSICTVSARTNPASRVVFKDYSIDTAGSGNWEIVFNDFEINPNSGTPNDDHYVSLVIYAYTGANSIVRLSNIKFEVYGL